MPRYHKAKDTWAGDYVVYSAHNFAHNFASACIWIVPGTYKED